MTKRPSLHEQVGSLPTPLAQIAHRVLNVGTDVSRAKRRTTACSIWRRRRSSSRRVRGLVVARAHEGAGDGVGGEAREARVAVVGALGRVSRDVSRALSSTPEAEDTPLARSGASLSAKRKDWPAVMSFATAASGRNVTGAQISRQGARRRRARLLQPARGVPQQSDGARRPAAALVLSDVC